MFSTFGPTSSSPLAGQINRIKDRMNVLQLEISSGRITNGSFQTGSRSLYAFQFRSELARDQSYKENANFTSSCITTMTQGLSSISNKMINFRDNLLKFKAGTVDREDTKECASDFLKSIPGDVNVSSYGDIALSGDRNSLDILQEYFSNSPVLSRQNYRDSFIARFGFSMDDMQSRLIGVSQIGEFLDAVDVSDQDPDEWTRQWLKADINDRKISVGRNKEVILPSLKSIAAFPKMTVSARNVAELASSSLSDDAFLRVIDHSLQQISTAQFEMTSTIAKLGSISTDLSRRVINIDHRNDFLNGEISKFDSVDQYATVAELNELKMQLEASYTMSARLGDLFLAKYI